VLNLEGENMKRLAFLVSVLGLLGGAGQAKADLIITVSQNGSDVVANGSGSLNFLGLSFSTFNFSAPYMNASAGTMLLGQQPNTQYTDVYTGNITGPTSFGPGGLFSATSGTSTAPNNTNAGIDGADHELFVPGGYGAGSPFTVSSTWANTTIAGLGLTPGSYTWTWGSGGNADSLTLNVAVPEPASMTLFAIGSVGVLGFYGRRRRCLA
jgi:hypothetical protein